MEEGERPIRWGCLVTVLALVAGAIGFAVWVNHDASLTAAGKEYDPNECESGLRQNLESQFRWGSLPHGSLEKVWIHGFQDHIFLYRIRLTREQFAGLRHAVISRTAEGAKLDDGDDLRLCPFGFGTSKPQGPEKMKIPAWWEVASLHSLDGLLWESSDGYWFGYDGEREILFLLNYTM